MGYFVTIPSKNFPQPQDLNESGFQWVLLHLEAHAPPGFAPLGFCYSETTTNLKEKCDTKEAYSPYSRNISTDPPFSPAAKTE